MPKRLLVHNMQKAMRIADLEFNSYREGENAHPQPWDAISSAA